MSDIQIDRMVKEIIEVSENGDIFDTLKVICDHDNWHNFKSRLEQLNSLKKLQEFFKELFMKCLSNVAMPESFINQWSEEMCNIFYNEDISKIDLKEVFGEAEEIIMEEVKPVEWGSKLYGKIIWALIHTVNIYKLFLAKIFAPDCF